MHTNRIKPRRLHIALLFAGMLTWIGPFAEVAAQNMADYTNYPILLNQAVPPNVLFLVDMGNATIEAAYSGTNHRYPLSFKTGTATASLYAANVTVDSQSDADLVAVEQSGNAIATARSTPATDCRRANNAAPTKSSNGTMLPR